MGDRIPFDAEFLFIETVRTGVVHIAVKYMPWHDLGEQVEASVSGGASFIALALAPTVTRCGKRTHPGDPSPNAPWRGTDRFHDEQLCVACYRTLHPDDHERAFEHAQPGDDEDDEPADAAWPAPDRSRSPLTTGAGTPDSITPRWRTP